MVMELEELKTMWQIHESKLEKAAQLNLKLLNMIQSQKVKSAIKPLLVKNSIVLAVHALTILALLIFTVLNISSLPYAISALVLLAYYTLLFVNTYQQIMAIKRMNQSDDVLGMQSSLTKLNTHILTFIRISVLTIPAFLSFPVVVPKAFADLNMNVFNGFDIIAQTNGNWWKAEIFAFIVLIPLGIWFYQQVTPQNIHKSWVRHIINTTASKNLNSAMRYLNELQEMKAA